MLSSEGPGWMGVVLLMLFEGRFGWDPFSLPCCDGGGFGL